MSKRCAREREKTAAIAGIAQLVEQLICNQQVIGSSPIAGSLVNRGQSRRSDFALGHFLAFFESSAIDSNTRIATLTGFEPAFEVSRL